MACQFCNGIDKFTNTYSEIWMGNLGKKKVLKISFNKCPPHTDCASKGLDIITNIIINYCPNCGAKLKEEGEQK